MENATIKVGIADDEQLYLEMLAECLNSEPDLEVVVLAKSVKEARTKFRESTVDVALLDVVFPDGNGIGLGVSLARENPDMSIVLISSGAPGDWLLEDRDPLRRNWSYVSKKATMSVSVLRDLVRLSAQGQAFADPAFFFGLDTERSEIHRILTRRQVQVLQLVAEGLANKEIGDQLGINESSVINHLSSIYSALGIPPEKNPRVVAVLHYLSSISGLYRPQ
jgi:DNA-binding NarL/FixJ family response regulator